MNPLYAYLYDDFLSDKAYERVIANVETRLSSLGIQGRTARLAIFRSARELVEELVRNGAQTIVVVGNDKSLQKVMWFLPDLPVTVGYIPVCEPSEIGSLLGIPQGEAACDVLSARRMDLLDVGMIDERYFLTEVRIDQTKAAIQIAGSYRLSPREFGTITIRNMGGAGSGGRVDTDPRDGFLDGFIRPIPLEAHNPRLLPWFRTVSPVTAQEETHVLFSEAMVISDEPLDIYADGQHITGFTFRISIVPRKLRFITGRSKRLDPVRIVGPVTLLPLLPKSLFVDIVSRARQIKDRWRNWYTR